MNMAFDLAILLQQTKMVCALETSSWMTKAFDMGMEKGQASSSQGSHTARQLLMPAKMIAVVLLIKEALLTTKRITSAHLPAHLSHPYPP
jgi:hypothetical protein